MEEVAESVEVDGWKLTRVAGTSVTGSPRYRAAEALSRLAEAEKFRAAVMLHDEAQRAVEPRLAALDNRQGMQISLRTGRMVSFAANDSAAMEISLLGGLSQGQAHRVLEQAETLVMDAPEVLESMALGRIGTSHVQRILEHLQHIVPEMPPAPPRDADEAAKEEWERDVAARAGKARADRRDFGVDMLALAPGKCPSQLRARGRQVLEKYYGLSFTKRSRTAMRDRRIVLEEAADGMTWLSGFLPTASCQAIFSKIDAMARLLKSDPDSAAQVTRAAREAAATGTDGKSVAAGEPEPDPAEERTMDQLRADVFTDVMLNGPRGQGLETVNAEVFVAIPATMLPGTPGGPTGIDTTPADGRGHRHRIDTAAAVRAGDSGPQGADVQAAAVNLAQAQLPPGAQVPSVLGGGPIDQESAARMMMAAKTWWRLVTDPITGAIVSFGQDRYRPSAAQRAALKFRDGGCTTPGCLGPARNCEIDHTAEWQDGGGTDLSNLHHGCKRCHRLKSLGLIEVEQRAGGTTLVTSLFGTTRVSYPAAPWAVADPRKATTGDKQSRTLPPPEDPDASIPPVQESSLRPLHETGPDIDDDQDKSDNDPEQPDDQPGKHTLANTHIEEKLGARYYQQLHIREWGRIEDVPDSSSPDPEHGRYARTSHAKATRKRRLKRNAGGYGRPAIHRPDDRDNPLRPPPEPPPVPPEEPPY